MLKFIKRALGIDKAVIWINITNLWSFVKSPIGLFFILTCLSIDEQGVWYAFISLGALSVFAELGFSLIISQFISHEYAKLSLKNGLLVGEEFYIDRLISLARYAIKVYCVVTILAVLILSGVGFFYFQNYSYVILFSWILFSVASGFSLLANLLQFIYRGIDQVASAQQAILISSILGTIVTLGALWLGFNIWSLPIGTFISAFILLYLVIHMAPQFWQQLYERRIEKKIKWSREIIWLQGKYAITFISVYFIFNLIVPAVFKFNGTVLAGQLGLTLAVIGGIQNFALAGVNARVPTINMLVATHQLKECYGLIKKTTIVSCIIYILGSLSFLGITWILGHTKYSSRFLNFPLLLLVLSYQLVPTLAACTSAFLRAHKEEPHLPLAIVQAIIIGTAIFTILPYFGLFWLLVVINVCFWLAMPIIYVMAINYEKLHTQPVLQIPDTPPLTSLGKI